MALPYPEGECFFYINGLKPTGFYNPINAENFFGYMMVEYIQNVEAEKNEYVSNHQHPRSSYHIVKKKNDTYGTWGSVAFQYGPNWTSVARRYDHELVVDPQAFRDHTMGESAKSFFMLMPMPTAEERWVWIDMLTHIRAIYLPISQTTSEDYPSFTYWVTINFALDRELKVADQTSDAFNSFGCSSTYGLAVRHDKTLCLDVTGLTSLLSLPRQLREQNAYNFRLIKIINSSSVSTAAVAAPTYPLANDYDWTTIAEANFGLDVQWVPPNEESEWLLGFLKTIITVALEFVPGVGPILACSFSLGCTLLFNPDEFFAEVLSMGVEGISSNDQDRLRASAEETKKYLPEGWEDWDTQPSTFGTKGHVFLPNTKTTKRKIRTPQKLEMSQLFQYAKSILEKPSKLPAELQVNEGEAA